jgi:ADP-ribose pyrophosphatase YjhB (NUDIX family)
MGKYRRPPYPYCPWCRGALPEENPCRQACSSCGFVLYHNSSPCVGAIPTDDRGRVLLGRRGVEPYRGDWNTVGGFLRYGEDPSEGLKREVKEELGVGCEVGEFITMEADTYGADGPALLNAYFHVRLGTGPIRPHDDVTELRWFPLDSLPENVAFASDRRALAVLRRKRTGPTLSGEKR